MSESALGRQARSTAEASFLGRLRVRYGEVKLMRPPLKGVRAYANWIRANYELRVGASVIKARPLKLTLDPTNVCQLRCPLCPTGLEIQDRAKGHARLDMFEHLMDHLGPYLFFIDFFNWGEPLLNTHLEDFIRLASARKIVCNVSTNLSLPLTDRRIDRLVSSGLHELIVSLDGASADSYATYRRGGKFDLVCGNIRRIVEAKRRRGQTFPLITWQFLVFRFNQQEIDKAWELAADMGVDRVLFRRPFLDVDRYPLSRDDKQEIAGWAPDDRLFQIEVPSGAATQKTYSRCGWHYMSSAINWDGSVAPCCTAFETRDDFGSVGKDGGAAYMDVVNNSAFRAVRERFAGRGKDPVALICEKCPTPEIMNYHRFLNRQVALFTLVAVFEKVTRPFRRRNRPLAASDPTAMNTAGLPAQEPGRELPETAMRRDG
jgi:MoaA/NifB/PqqE/SkfB family radical SAM enzyme